MDKLLDVVNVEPRKDNTLLLVFENQEKRLFDITPYLDKKPFTKLKDPLLFMKATVAFGTVVWPGNIDIAPETLWDYSKPPLHAVKQEEILL
ncbi:MAG: DUF2442 domain-containing protein [Candidatus Cloacimonadales bacterium]|nr:DUF2442 domain-containing protein [Candidatus Cloacimonadales bacterium]